MSALIIDIETSGENWEKIDAQTQKILADRIKRDKPEITDDQAAESARGNLALSPYTGQIIALGVLDSQTKKGAVYYQAPTGKTKEAEIDGIKLSVQIEIDLLKKFWQLTERYQKFVTFSGRTFDLPFIMIRSAIHGLPVPKDLMRGRYLYQQTNDAVHIDLHDQLSFYGSISRLGGLHLACRAFGIETPKDGSIDGAEVPRFFAAKKYQEIAEYNARDLLATCALYEKWQKTLAF